MEYQDFCRDGLHISSGKQEPSDINIDRTDSILEDLVGLNNIEVKERDNLNDIPVGSCETEIVHSGVTETISSTHKTATNGIQNKNTNTNKNKKELSKNVSKMKEKSIDLAERRGNETELCIKIMNIHGLKENKLSMMRNETNSFFNKIFRSSDFVVFIETWTDKANNDLLNWDHTHEEIIRKCGQRTSRKGCSSGGISFSAKKNSGKTTKYCQPIHTGYGLNLTRNS